MEKKNWQKERGAVCEARLLPSLTAHVPTTNPMFFPCFCHHLHTENPRALTLTAVQSFPTRLLKLDDKSSRIYIFTPTVWLVNFRCYTYRGIKRSYPPNNIIKGNPHASGVSNNPSVASAPQVLWADSGSIRWWKFPVLSLNLKNLSKFRLRGAEALQNKGVLQIRTSMVLKKLPPMELKVNARVWSSHCFLDYTLGVSINS